MTETNLAQTALIIIPTYNEAENIERLVGEILAQPVAAHVLIVDDNSPDGTGQLADALATRYDRVHVLHRAAKLGLGTAYIAGFGYALQQGYGYAMQMDADFSHHPRHLPAMLKLAETCDLVLGSRYIRGGGTTGWPVQRAFLSRGANAFAKFILGLKTHDCTGGYRCYRAATLRAISLETIFSSGYSFQVETVTRCERRGYRVGEVPIIFDNRRLGQSKISRGEIYKSFYTIFRLRLPWLPWERWLSGYRPRKEGGSE